MAFENLEKIEEKEIVPGFRVKFVHSDTMTFAYWDIDAGAELRNTLTRTSRWPIPWKENSN